MSAITKWAAAGWEALQWSYRSNLGYLTGAAGLTVASTGTSSSMARHLGANTADIALPDPTIVSIPGDNTTIAQFQFDGDGFPEFTIEMSVFDSVFHAAVTGLTAATDGDTEMSQFAFGAYTSNPMFLMLTRDLKSQKAGQVGAKGYEHLELFNTAVRFLGSGFTTKGAAVYRYRVTCNDTDILPDGRTLSTVFSTAPNGRLGGIIRSADNRYSYSVLVGDNAETDVTTAYKPISIAKSKAVIETTGFAADTVTAIDTSAPYGITATGTPGSGKILTVRYEFLSWE